MFRIGIGYDIHRLEEGLPFRLGGVLIPHEKGLVGHSDADALAHAITDALLGALALSDIGTRFPDTDPHFKDADSMKLLGRTLKVVNGAGYRIVNVDTNIIAERPKLQPYIEAMRQRIATELDILKGAVSIKAKTNENVGPVGREEAISTQAIVLLQQDNDA